MGTQGIPIATHSKAMETNPVKDYGETKKTVGRSRALWKENRRKQWSPKGSETNPKKDNGKTKKTMGGARRIMEPTPKKLMVCRAMTSQPSLYRYSQRYDTFYWRALSFPWKLPMVPVVSAMIALLSPSFDAHGSPRNLLTVCTAIRQNAFFASSSRPNPFMTFLMREG